MPDIEKRVLASLYPGPSWFPQSVDPTREWLRMVRYRGEDFRAAPFLDRRGLREGMASATLRFADVASQVPPTARRDAHWIFHISHVGSTLISRLLGEVADVLALREPELLHALVAMSEAERASRLPVIRALLSRSFGKRQRAIVKATSHVSEQAVALIGPVSDGGKALMIRISPKRFIAARLGGNLGELRARTPERLARMESRVPGLDGKEATKDDAHRAALAWAAEASAMEAAARQIAPGRLFFLDFDAFLADPDELFARVLMHFDLPLAQDRRRAIIKGPLMTRYSKGSAASFDAATREAKIAAQFAEHGAEIAAAMRWLERLGQNAPVVADALGRVAD